MGEVIEKINPILRGWVQYFAIGHSDKPRRRLRAVAPALYPTTGMREKLVKELG